MKFDVYVIKGRAMVFKRAEVAECGELPEGAPLFESAEDGDWVKWCDERSSDEVRVFRLVGVYPSAFAEDAEKKAQRLFDRYREGGAALGWGLLSVDRSDMIHTFRRSANWKNEPTLFTFDQPLKWSARHDGSVEGEAMRVRDNIVMLYGMSDGLHELGLDLVFDEAFRVRLVGVREEWRAEFD